MPKNKVSDPITDQEMTFARLVLSGGMTDRQAAEAVGLNPDSAAYTKSKPRVRDYMLEHRAAVQQQLVQQEAEGQHRLNLDREQVLARLWEIAHLSPEITRGSITGQVKALSMIVAMQNFIPDRRAIASEKKSTPAPTAEIYPAAWRAKQQATTPATTNDPQPTPSPARPAFPGSAGELPPTPGLTPSAFVNRVGPPGAEPLSPYLPVFTSLPDTRIPSSVKKNHFASPR
jgi:hypothetical protein